MKKQLSPTQNGAWWLFYTAVAALMISLVVSPAAQAAWSNDNVEAGISAPYNGNIAAVSNICTGASISLYDANGAKLWTAGGGRSDTYDPLCAAQVVADAAGNLYVPGLVASTAESGSPSYVLLSYAQDGTQRWVVPLEAIPTDSEMGGSGETRPPNIAVGTDGNVYILAGTTPNDHILGFAASDGHQILDVPLGVYWDNATPGLTVALSASTDGLAVSANEEYRLYGYDGVLKADSTVADAPDFTGQQTSIAGGGQSLLLSESYGLATCGQHGTTPLPQQFNVTARGPTGTVWQATSATTTAPCLGSYELFVRATPDGGAVVTGDPSTGEGGNHLAELDNQGHVRWDIPITDPSLTDELAYYIRVTTTGEVVLFQGATAPCIGIEGQTSCHEVIITFHNASDGGQTRPAIVLSDPNSAYANTTPDLQYAPLVLPNRIVADLYGAAPDVVGPQYPVLQSLDVEGLAGDYQTLLETPTATPTEGSGGGLANEPTGAGHQFVYRAIGDSIAAGFGLKVSDERKILACATADKLTPDCDSRDEAYPGIIAGKTPPVGPAAVGFQPLTSGVNYDNLALSRTPVSYWLEPAHLQPVISANPDLLTITLGADDVLGAKDAFGGPCALNVRCVAKTVAGTQTGLELLLNRLGRRTHAKLVLTQYHSVPFDRIGAVAWINNAILQAAENQSRYFPGRIVVTPVPHIPLSSLLCLQWRGLKTIFDLCLHPNLSGQTVYARAILDTLRSSAAPPMAHSTRISWRAAVEDYAMYVGATDVTLHFKIIALGKHVYNQALITIQRAAGRRSSAAHRSVVTISAKQSRTTRRLIRSRRIVRLHFTNGVAAVSIKLPRRQVRKGDIVMLQLRGQTRCSRPPHHNHHHVCGASLTKPVRIGTL